MHQTDASKYSNVLKTSPSLELKLDKVLGIGLRVVIGDKDLWVLHAIHCRVEKVISLASIWHKSIFLAFTLLTNEYPADKHELLPCAVWFAVDISP